MTEREQRITDASDIIEQNEMLIARELIKDDPNLEYIGTLIEFNVKYARNIREVNSASEQMFEKHKDIYMKVDPPQDRGKLVMKELIKGLNDPKMEKELNDTEQKREQTDDEPDDYEIDEWNISDYDVPSNVNFIGEDDVENSYHNIKYIYLIFDVLKKYYMCKFEVDYDSYEELGELKVKIKIENEYHQANIDVVFTNDDRNETTLDDFENWMFVTYGNQFYQTQELPTDTTQIMK